MEHQGYKQTKFETSVNLYRTFIRFLFVLGTYTIYLNKQFKLKSNIIYPMANMEKSPARLA